MYSWTKTIYWIKMLPFSVLLMDKFERVIVEWLQPINHWVNLALLGYLGHDKLYDICLPSQPTYMPYTQQIIENVLDFLALDIR